MALHLKHLNGHLLYNPGGHLVHSCQPIAPEFYYRLINCNIPCGTEGCDGSEPDILTDSDLDVFRHRIVKIVGDPLNCWRIVKETATVGAVPVTIAISYSECTGHFVNNCCPDGPRYRLTQCGVTCPNIDCDGNEPSIVVPYLDMLKAIYDTGNRIIRYRDICWVMTESCDEVTEGIVIGTNFATCEECCDDCYACDGCEYSSASTLTVKLEWFGLYHHRDVNCASGTTHCLGERYGPVTLTKTDCNVWRSGSPLHYSNRGPGGGPLPPCSWQEVEAPYLFPLSIRKNCTTGKWEYSITRYPPLVFIPLDEACKETHTFHTFFGDLGTGCNGGNASGHVCCHRIGETWSNEGDYDSYIIVNNNTCNPWFGAP